jgi:hypothetical protein
MIKSRRVRWAWHVTQMGGERNAYRLLVGKPEGKRQLGRPRRRWTDITMNPIYEGVVWTGLIWLRTGTCGGLL